MEREGLKREPLISPKLVLAINLHDKSHALLRCWIKCKKNEQNSNELKKDFSTTMAQQDVLNKQITACKSSQILQATYIATK